MTVSTTSQPTHVPAQAADVLGPSTGNGSARGVVGTHSGRRESTLRPTGWWAVADLGKPLLIYLGGLAVILAAGEGVLAWQAFLNPPPRRFMNRYPTPYVEFYGEPNYNHDGISTNEVGFRYGSIPKQKPPGEFRIFFLAASAGFRGATNGTTISGFMEKMIAQRATVAGKRVRVVNASGTSFVTRQSLVLLITKVLDYEPDVIIVFQGPESLYYPVVYEERVGYPFGFKAREASAEQLMRYLERPNAIAAAIAGTHLMQWFHPDLVRKMMQTKLSILRPHVPLTSVAELEPHMEGVANDVSKMIRIAAAYGCRTIVAMPPWLNRGVTKDAIPTLSERLKETCAQAGDAGAIFLDASPIEAVLTAGGLWDPDQIHWLSDGNRIMATEFVRVLVENKLVN